MYEQQTQQEPSNQSQYQADQIQQPPPGWWSRNWKWAVPTGCIALVGGGVGFFVLIFALIFGVMKSTEVYETALYEAQTNPAVIEHLGNRIEDGLIFTGNMEVNPSSGYADIVIPIAGQKGSGSLYVQAEKVAGSWEYYTLEVAVHGSDISIDLLEE
ncbi:MAG: hypothetical protein IIB53_04520 [Planctomycetes bacterium]|nr:hypothetical protein [Planctomycetota bacterium]